MTDWLNSWKDFERICSVSGITPEEMERRGKRFLTYHKMLCCTPEYILPPEPAGSSIEKKEHFLKRIEELFENDCEELTEGDILYDLSADLTREMVETALTEIRKIEKHGDDYYNIIHRKHTGISRETDEKIYGSLLMSKAKFYKKQNEAYGYMAFYMWKIYPTEQRRMLWPIKHEAALQPKEVMYV